MKNNSLFPCRPSLVTCHLSLVTCRLSLVPCRLLLVAFLVACCLSLSGGLYSAGGVGTTSATFLKIGVGARNIAMGETGAASEDVNSVYWNPAGLNSLTGKEASLMHAVWLDDINFEHAAAGYPTKYGTFGLGLNYLSMNPIQEYDVNDTKLGTTYKPYDAAGTISYARTVYGVPLGVNVKYIYEKIDTERAWAVAGDVGCAYDGIEVMGQKLRLGAVVQNIGTKVKFVSVGDDLPLNVKFGGSYSFINSEPNYLLAAVDINIPSDNKARLGVGAEYTRKLGNNIFVSARAGYKTNTEVLSAISGLTAGAGFRYDGYTVDYAWVPYRSDDGFSDLGDTQRISLGIKW